jgi:hypothetical protein
MIYRRYDMSMSILMNRLWDQVALQFRALIGQPLLGRGD